MFKKSKLSLPFIAFLQASALVGYIGLVVIFMNTISQTLDGKMNSYTAPILMLLVFVISATVSGAIVLGKAGYLFWEKKYKQSFTLLGWTILWGFLYLALILALALTQ